MASLTESEGAHYNTKNIVLVHISGPDPGFLKRGGSILGFQAKKGGGAGGDPTLGPMF